MGEPLTADIVCAGCGYNLRGLEREGKCPECGGEVERSWLAHQLLLANQVVPLEQADAAWVGKIALGCALLLVSGAMEALDISMPLVGMPDWATLPVFIVMVASLPAGFWLITAREHGRTSRRETILRVAVRIGVGLELMILAVLIYVFFRRRAFEVISILARVQTGIALVLMNLTMIHLATLAKRMRRDRLRRVMIALAWLLPATSLARQFWFPDFPITANSYWQVGPHILLGELAGSVLLVHSLWQWPRMDAIVAYWMVLTGLCAAATIAMAVLTQGLWSVKRGGVSR